MEPLFTPAEQAHLHILLNHVPTVGTLFGVGMFVLAFIRRNDHLKKVSLEAFCVIALLTLPAYITGVGAQSALRGRQEVLPAAMAMHQDAAFYALVLMAITGALAWLGLWQFRRQASPPRATLTAVFVMSMVTLAVITATARLGGDIRHPEISAAGAAVGTLGAGGNTVSALNVFIQRNSWVWPAGEALHFLGMSLLFGVVLVVNLRLLGFMPQASFAAVHRLLPWGILGFGINLVTGMLFFIGEPQQYTDNPAFYWKVILLLLAGVNYLYLTAFDTLWSLGPGDRPRATSRLIAASSLCLWLGVMYFGRMLPFLGTAF